MVLSQVKLFRDRRKKKSMEKNKRKLCLPLKCILALLVEAFWVASAELCLAEEFFLARPYFTCFRSTARSIGKMLHPQQESYGYRM